MDSPNGAELKRGHYALVSYISGPLATFLDTLSLDLAPDSNPQAHVTILPPRPYGEDIGKALSHLGAGCHEFRKFEVEIGDVEIFGLSNVVFLGLKNGSEQLHNLYSAFNRGCLSYCEPFPYHPHVTIAQDLDEAEAVVTAAAARERWREYAGKRSFAVEALSLVRNDAPLIWTDVGTLVLP